MKKMILLFVILFVVILIIYMIPAIRKDFFKSYSKKDTASMSLDEFMQKPTKTIEVAGIKWQYLTYGNGDKTIVFAHGMGGAYNLWWQQMAYFKDHYRVLSYSLPEEINNLEDASKGILKILEKEKIENFYLVGTSMGGYIAQYLTHKIPERIEKVVFSNTFPPNILIETKNKKKSEIIPWMPEILISYFGQKKLHSDIVPAANNSKLLEAFLPSLPFSKKQFINRYYVVVDKFIPTPCLYKIKRIPKLIIESDNDPLVEKSLRENLKETYPDASVFTFHNQGHFPYINDADKYNKVLDDFFKSENEYKKLEQTIASYFNGRRDANITLLQQAFSKNANLFTVKNSVILKISLENYFKKVMQDGKTKVKTTILNADILRNMAICKTRFDYPNKSYVDYLTLLKVKDNWKITTKNFVLLDEK